MEIKEGCNDMAVFGNEFSHYSYCWKIGDTLWLSLIDVKEEHRKKGVLTRLLEDVKKDFKVVIIPTPFAIVQTTALKHGYKMFMIDDVEQGGKMESAIWDTSNIQAANNNIKKEETA